MVLAVDPAALGGEPAAQQRLEAGVEIALAREELLGQLGGTAFSRADRSCRSTLPVRLRLVW